MRRREFITLAGASAAAWPLTARAQPDVRVRRVGWLIGGAENDREAGAVRTALQEELVKFGWVEGSNLRIDVRFGAEPDAFRAYAAELVGLAPDVIVTYTGAALRAVQQQTQTIPIVFAAAGDAVAAGYVRNIAHPEGNITGFSSLEPSVTGKCLALLKEAAPNVARVAVVFSADLMSQISQSYFASIDVAASALGVQAVRTPIRGPVDIVRQIDRFAAAPNGGILLLPPPPTTAFREAIVQLAVQHRLPAIYPSRADVTSGGLLAYSSDRT